MAYDTITDDEKYVYIAGQLLTYEQYKLAYDTSIAALHEMLSKISASEMTYRAQLNARISGEETELVKTQLMIDALKSQIPADKISQSIAAAKAKNLAVS